MATVVTPVNRLVPLHHATQALDKANSLSEIKVIRDKAEAVRKYAQSAALGLSAQNQAAEIKLRAERKAGQLLAGLALRGGDRKSNNRSECLKLEDLGISQNQSTRWQLQARLPDGEFEDYLTSAREHGQEISSSAVLRLARQKSTTNRERRTTARVKRRGKFSGEGREPVNNVLDDRDQWTRVRDGLDDLTNHRTLLTQLLEPLYTKSDAELLPAQRRVLGHILREMQIVLQELHLVACQRPHKSATTLCSA